MQKRFTHEFEDQGSGALTYEVTDKDHLEVKVEDGLAVLYVNRQGAALLARIAAQMSLGSYEEGFHLHLERNFDPDEPEALRLVLVE